MHCRGKCLQLAALLLAVACGPAAGAAVHRARGVDFITAQLIGSSVSSHVRQSSDDRPNAHFSRDAWQPVQEDSRDLVPQPRAVTETEAVVVSSELKSKPNDESKRGPEVEDSIAAVTSQLLNNPQTVLDVRTPPAKKQEVEPSPDKKWQQMQMVQTNTNITIKGTAQTPLVVSNETPTRFPPRVTSTPAAVNATKKPTAATVVLEKQTTIPALVTKAATKPTTAPPKTTQKEVVTTTPAPVKPTTAATVVKKVEQLANKRPAVSPPFAILSRIESPSTTPKPAPTTEKFTPTAQTTVKFKPTVQTTEKSKTTVQTTVMPAIRRGAVTPVAPVTVVTESIPTVATTKKPPKKPVAKPYRPPSASVVTRPPQAISTFIPETFEILSTEKTITKVATTTTTTTTTTTPAPTTTTTTTTAAPATKTKKKKNKKNKKRRRRPSSKPENKIDSELEEKEEKPLTSRIIDYLSGEGIPSFGTTVVGLLMTAGLAGLLFFPMEGFARRSDHFKREDENEGLMPSILKAVYTSMHPNPENDLHTEEQGPRRFRRNVHRRTKRQYRFERVPYRPVPEHLRSPMYKQAPADSTNIMQIEAGGNQPFSLVRLVKQMLAVKLDVLSNVLRMASEQLRNYAQNAEVQRPPKPSTTTTEPTTETATDVEAETTEVPSEEMVLVKAPTTASTTTTTTTEPLNDEENLIRRRTAD
ncbi:mucin-5AC-like isoform X2 [Cloeon dipterum]|uniref:mucin-5AC-like isoform X2 n=1 Tax=Cloeon dipterum TaxID=197152 RepID=UPI003220546D